MIECVACPDDVTGELCAHMLAGCSAAMAKVRIASMAFLTRMKFPIRKVKLPDTHPASTATRHRTYLVIARGHPPRDGQGLARSADVKSVTGHSEETGAT